MGMGPRCGIGELVIPAVAARLLDHARQGQPRHLRIAHHGLLPGDRHDAAVTIGNLGGVGSLLDLNVAMPMMGANVLDSIRLLARGCAMFTDNLLEGLRPDEARCKELIEGSLAMCTSLVPVIGYDKAAALAKRAFKQGKTVRALAHETLVGQKDNAGKAITKAAIDSYLNPWSMTLPGGEGSRGGWLGLRHGNFETRSRVGPDGKLHIDVPPSMANTDVRVKVELAAPNGSAANGAPPRPTREQRSAALRRLAGSVSDPTFERPPQGEFEAREPLD